MKRHFIVVNSDGWSKLPTQDLAEEMALRCAKDGIHVVVYKAIAEATPIAQAIIEHVEE